jgi:hypothetical protein
VVDAFGRLNHRCDQARLVRKEMRCEYSTEIRSRHLTGANPVRSKPPCRSVATPGDGSGNGLGDAEVGERVSRVKSASKIIMYRVPTVSVNPKAAAASSELAYEEAHGAGSWYAARSKKMTQEPGIPRRSVKSRRFEARETGAEDRMRLGVGGPRSSDEAGERVTSDPVERKGARVGSNFRRET